MFSMSKPIEIVFSEKKTPPLHSPHLICGFPGTGLVGKLAVDYLIKELGAIHMADLLICSCSVNFLDYLQKYL